MMRIARIKASFLGPRVAQSRAGILCLACALLVLFAVPAAADFRLCNNTGSRVGIAIGYKDSEGWSTEGWWNLVARSCETLVKGQLGARFYYV